MSVRRGSFMLFNRKNVGILDDMIFFCYQTGKNLPVWFLKNLGKTILIKYFIVKTWRYKYFWIIRDICQKRKKYSLRSSCGGMNVKGLNK